MNKTLLVVLIVLALALIAYNVTLVNFSNPLEGNSIVAIIGIMASLCAIVLLLLYVMSKKVQKEVDKD
ncbi:hypothetical protein EJ994_12315 [Maribacter sp. MJ134]|jgi:uncharacterized membrane protein (DUF485 family)|uniref:hypothetical protein n=1 Tax=Maribacter sp. MJ134 TaxID=2496865 RepID=UPI000F831553|nr:hypothetical protein [Maribacter sp. MJ134]AZQ59552.1 hypothetical protein EJ994_12315 [Maribacter sp. MJ134]